MDSLLGAVLVVFVGAHVSAISCLGLELYGPRRFVLRPFFADPLACFLVGWATGWVTGFDRDAVNGAAFVGFVVCCVAVRRARNLRPAGVVTFVTVVVASAALVPLLFGVFAGLPVSGWTKVPLLLSTVLTTLLTPSILIQTFEGWDPILRARWRRPHEPRRDWVPTAEAPMVSIHVPAYAEPPELVIATLDALARLDYPNFEVLLIDNNTRDERLWRPVAEHCAALGPRFRFFHVEGITGAKAGALNWSRPHTDPSAELIAYIDADYQVDPDWLRHTVGYFEDPNVGFVQCPHAYRDFEHSAFGRMANGTYSLFMYTEMMSLNEHGSGITVGTMSVIRLAALDAAKGWAEWCLTEDSELAIRIHALGYSSIYVRRPYGWGVIPETFAAFKKQRFRWTYGPGQELKAHHRMYLPGRRHVPSALTPRQRLHHFNHGFSIFMLGTKLLTVPLQFLTLLSLLVHREYVPAHLEVLLPLLVVLWSRHLMRWYLYHKVIGATFREFLGANLVLMSLSFVMCIAGFGLLLGRPARWVRTSKFRVFPERFRALGSTLPEILFAVVYLAFGAAVLGMLPRTGLAPLLAVGLAWQGLIYATAPVVALIAELDLARPRPSAVHRWLPLQTMPWEHRPTNPRRV
ncbi:MAG TPA: glycosyltransferase [Kineosporiaceae bacterium]